MLLDSVVTNMESCTAAVNTRTHLFQAGKNGVLGETQMRHSLKNRDLSVRLWKKSHTPKLKARNVKHGVAYSVLPDTNHKLVEHPATLEPPFFRIATQAESKNVVAMILGGGAGTRLFPLTRQRAKPAVPFGGSYRLIDVPVSNCINSGIGKIYILTQFNSFSLNRHIARTYSFGEGMNFDDGFIEVLAATQTPGEAGMDWFQGTADAVRQFLWVFEEAKNRDIEHILILPGDHLYRMDFMDLIQYHQSMEADITVSCVPIDYRRASDCELLKIDDSGSIIHYAEKPTGLELKLMQADTSLLGLSEKEAIAYPYIASMGVYVFRKDVLLEILKMRYPGFIDFDSEVIPSAIADFHIQAFLFNDYWVDIGTIESFFAANLALTDQPPKFDFNDPETTFYTDPTLLPPTKVDNCKIVNSLVSHGCFLKDCFIQHSVVGVRSRLESGVELQDTVMMGADDYQTISEITTLLAKGKVPVGVGQNTKIRKCIIDKNAKIGKDVVIANKDGVEEADRPEEGFYIRSGITVILKNATIKDGTVI